MPQPLKYVHLHSPLFFGGKNFGEKLDPVNNPQKFAGIKMYLATDDFGPWLFIEWGDRVSRLPLSSIHSAEEGEIQKPKVVLPAPTGKPIQAQVSTPQSHVFEKKK